MSENQSFAMPSAFTEFMQEQLTRFSIEEDYLVTLKRNTLNDTQLYGLAYAAAYALGIEAEILTALIHGDPHPLDALEAKGISAGLEGFDKRIFPFYVIVGIENYRLPADLLVSAIAQQTGQQIGAIHQGFKPPTRKKLLDDSVASTQESLMKDHAILAIQSDYRLFSVSAVPDRQPSEIELQLMAEDTTGVRLLEQRLSEMLRHSTNTLQAAKDAQIQPIVRAISESSPYSIIRDASNIIGFKAGMERYKELLSHISGLK